MKILMITATVLLLITSCYSCPTEADIIGKYSLKLNNGINIEDSIIIFSNGMYIHKFISTNGITYQIEGKWIYNKENCEILFKEFTFFNDSGYSDLPRGNWYSRVKVYNEEIRLYYSQENNIYFSKNT